MKIKNVPKPKRKPPVPKMMQKSRKKKKNIGQLNKSRSITKQRLDKNEISKEMGEDYTTMPVEKPIKKMGGGYMKKDMMGGGMVGGQKKLDVNKDGMITGADFEMMGANRKKNGGKISYKMAGGKVVDSSYD